MVAAPRRKLPRAGECSLLLLSTEITKPLTCDKNKMFYFCHCGASSNENVLSEDARSPLTPVEIVAFLLRFLNSLYLVNVYRDSETATAPYYMLSALNKIENLSNIQKDQKALLSTSISHVAGAILKTQQLSCNL